MEAIASASARGLAPLSGYGNVLVKSGRGGSGALPPWQTVGRMGGMGMKSAAGHAEVGSVPFARHRWSGVAGVEAPLPLPAADANNLIPGGFVFPESTRATLAHDVFDLDLPVIDLAVFGKLEALRRETEIAGGDDVRGLNRRIAECREEGKKVLRQLRAACVEYGFFQIVNHGFPMPLVDNLRDIAETFFRKPLEEKAKTSNPKRLTGYITGAPTSSDKQGNRMWRETFGVRMVLGRSGDDAGIAHLAHHLAGEAGEGPTVTEAVRTYVRTMESIALQVLELLAQSFDRPETTFSEHFRDKADRTCLFHINHYPVCPQPDLALGTHPHTDPFAINIVHQDQVGGLQVVTSDGEWHGVKPIPGALVVNIGDLLQMWTNDRLLSAEHRVVGNREQSRMSFCFFYNPSRLARIVPPAGFVDEQHPRRYRTFQTYEFSDVVTSHGASRSGMIVQKLGLNSEQES